MSYPESFGCPHCLGARIVCCACRGMGTLATLGQLEAAMAWAWARVGCGCAACRLVGKPPVTA